MSRTIRNIPLYLEWNPYKNKFEKWTVYGYFRSIRTTQTKKIEASAAQALRDEGFSVPPRHASRANPSGAIPSAWDDLNNSAYNQMDYNDGQIFKVEEARWP